MAVGNSPPQATTSDRPTLVVVGGGIAGLAAAHRLQERAPRASVVLLEAGNALGGLLHTRREHGFVIEEAAENFFTGVPWAVELCRRVGLDDQLISADPRTRGVLVLCGGRLQPIPPGFGTMAPTRVWPLLASGVLTLRGKLRLAMEPFLTPRREDCDESIGAFARRRLGTEMYERLVEPLVGSIYGADPDEMSLAAVFPQFREMEQASGSLWRGQQMRRMRTHDRIQRDPFAAPRAGMSSLVNGLANRLRGGTIQLGSSVKGLHRTEDCRWTIEIGEWNSRWLVADGVVLATPAYVCARMLSGLDPPIADELSRIAYRDITMVAMGYQRHQIACSLDKHGIVLRRNEGRQLLQSVSFSSVKYSGRAPQGMVLMRASVRQDSRRAVDLADDQLEAIVDAELSQLLGISGKPVYSRVLRRYRAMPVYQLGHLQRIARIRQLLAKHAGLELAGAAYGGSGVPQCICGGERAADEVLDQIPAAAVETQDRRDMSSERLTTWESRHGSLSFTHSTH